MKMNKTNHYIKGVSLGSFRCDIAFLDSTYPKKATPLGLGGLF